MVHKAQQTSLEAFTALSKTKVRRDYQIILGALSSLETANNTMINRRTLIPINIVTARVSELRKLGKLELDRKDICPINKTTTMFWRIRNG